MSSAFSRFPAQACQLNDQTSPPVAEATERVYVEEGTLELRSRSTALLETITSSANDDKSCDEKVHDVGNSNVASRTPSVKSSLGTKRKAAGNGFLETSKGLAKRLQTGSDASSAIVLSDDE